MDQHGYERTRKNRLTTEEVENVHKAFIEANGNVCVVAQDTGYSISTVSRYAKRNGWREELLMQGSAKQLDQYSQMISNENAKDGDIENLVISKLVTIREMLFREIMGKEEAGSTCKMLKILPRTLAEAVKALIDIDKRITERVEAQSIDTQDIYQNILMKCAETIDD